MDVSWRRDNFVSYVIVNYRYCGVFCDPLYFAIGMGTLSGGTTAAAGSSAPFSSPYSESLSPAHATQHWVRSYSVQLFYWANKNWFFWLRVLYVQAFRSVLMLTADWHLYMRTLFPAVHFKALQTDFPEVRPVRLRYHRVRWLLFTRIQHLADLKWCLLLRQQVR